MADVVFNISKGAVSGYYQRVDAGDPATSALVIVALKASGIESDATLQDYDDLAALLGAANDEATNSGYARKVLSAADLVAFAPDDTNNRVDLDIPDQTWTAVQATGGAWGALLVCYRPATGSADSAVVPLTKHDFSVVPDGSDITAQINVGFFRAS